jgi:hypothetical protein
MRSLKTSDISSAVGFPVKGGTLNHLQLAYKEAIDALARSVISNYQPNTAYRLYGLINSGNGIDYNISAGAVFYNGEIYLVDATIFSLAVNQVAVLSIVTTYFNDPSADPVQFTDGNARTVHEIRKVVIGSGLSGSGIADFVNLKRSNKGKLLKGMPQAYMPPSGNLNDFDATGKGISGDVVGWAICNGQNGTMNLKGRMIAGYDPQDTSFNILGGENGEKTHTLAMNELPAEGVEVVASDGTALKYGQAVPGVHDPHLVRTDTDTTYGSIGFKTKNLGLGDPHNNMPPYKVLVYVQEID